MTWGEKAIERCADDLTWNEAEVESMPFSNSTLRYYADHTYTFMQATIDADMSESRDWFLAYLPAGAHILDFGCGSGRDAKAFEGIRSGRYFTDFTEESLTEFWSEFPALKITELWITQDVRPGREEERWINLLARRV